MLLFTYGLLRDPRRMHTLDPRASRVGPIELRDYRVARRVDGFATIVPSPGGRTRGVLWRVANLRALERFEGPSYRLVRLSFRNFTTSVRNPSSTFALGSEYSVMLPVCAFANR